MNSRLSYLLALAETRHFGRAAALAGVSQPTLSHAIRQLEGEFGVPIVERGRTFHGFTPEGEAVLAHARRMQADRQVLEQDLRSPDAGLAGPLGLGVIPTALPLVAGAIGPFARTHPGVRFRVLSLSSRQIVQHLNDYDLDLGLTYLDTEALDGFDAWPLYRERYVLLTAQTLPPNPLPWRAIADLPLCLLTPDMQNRRIVDGALAEAGLTVRPGLETNSLITLVNAVRHGPWASVVPVQLLDALPLTPGLTALPLVEPEIDHVIGFIAPRRGPVGRVVQAFVETFNRENLPNNRK